MNITLSLTREHKAQLQTEAEEYGQPDELAAAVLLEWLDCRAGYSEWEESPALNLPAHVSKRIKHEDLEADVDILMAPLILRLWKHGIYTTNCCQGGPNRKGAKRTYIQFATRKDGFNFLIDCQHVIDEYEMSADGEGSCGEMSVRFLQRDIKKIERCFPLRKQKQVTTDATQ